MEDIRINEERVKKAWVKPVLEVLDINRDTRYWEFKFNAETGFYQNVEVDDSLACFS